MVVIACFEIVGGDAKGGWDTDSGITTVDIDVELVVADAEYKVEFTAWVNLSYRMFSGRTALW